MSRTVKWLISVDECDVAPDSRSNLEEYRTRREDWGSWLSHDEHHAIDNQISLLVWNDAIYRLLYEIRRHTILSGKDKFACLNNHLSCVIDIGYTQFQLSTIRRLIEKGKDREPKKQIISLRRLVDDLSRFSERLTREVYVCFDGTPYDYTSFERFYEGLPAATRTSRIAPERPHRDAWSEARHECFDGYSEKTPSSRDRRDIIKGDFFENIVKTLESAPFERIKTHFDKTVAHAADEFSRTGAPLDGVPFNDIWDCHKAIIGVRNEIACVLNLPHLAAMPLNSSDVFENLSAPFALKSCFAEVIGEWEQENHRRDAWANLSDSTPQNQV